MVFDVAYTHHSGATFTLLGLSGQQADWVRLGVGARLISITPRRIDQR